MIRRKAAGLFFMTLLAVTAGLTGCDLSKYQKEETVKVIVKETITPAPETTTAQQTTEVVTTERATAVKNTATTTQRETFETEETLETLRPIGPTQQISEYMFPDSNTTYLTMDRLRGMTAEQAEIARNEIFARHGRLFNDAGLQAYFNQCSWYNGTIAPENFDSGVFNQYELANIQLISEYEDYLENGYGA